MKLILVSVALILAGCQTKPLEAMSYSELKAVADQIHKRCLEQGTKPNTQEYQICINQEARREHVTRTQNRERVSNAFASLGAGLQNAGNSYTQAAQNRPVNCTSRRTPSGSVSTNCY